MPPAVLVLVRATRSADREEADDLAREAVGVLTGTAPDSIRVGRVCPRCASVSHGRPVVLPSRTVPRPPRLSLSRAEGILLAAVTTGGPVGVDVEVVDSARFEEIGDVLLHPEETASTRAAREVTWVRKESLLKATGDGLHVDPRVIRLSQPEEPPGLLEWAAPGRPGRVWMQDLDVAGYVACLTVLTAGRPEVSLRWEASGAEAR